MVEVTASCPLLATPEQAWELICDPHRYAEWVVGTDAVTRTDGRARAGSTYDEANTILGPRKARTTWTVIEFSAPRRQVHTSADVPLRPRVARHNRKTVAAFAGLVRRENPVHTFA